MIVTHAPKPTYEQDPVLIRCREPRGYPTSSNLFFSAMDFSQIASTPTIICCRSLIQILSRYTDRLEIAPESKAADAPPRQILSTCSFNDSPARRSDFE